MADFAVWSVAAEPACPWPDGAFLEAYAGNRQGSVESTLDGDPVADVVRALAPWSGTATELLTELNTRTDEAITRRKDWFSRPRQVSDALRRIAPGLRKVGLDVDFVRHGRARTRLIEIVRVDSSAASASSAGPDSGGDRADAGGNGPSPSSARSSADQGHVLGGADAADAADAVKRHFLDEEIDGLTESEERI
jgi:hypothetical protein